MFGEGGEFIKRSPGIEDCGFAGQCSAPLADDEAAARVIDDVAIVNENAAAAWYIS